MNRHRTSVCPRPGCPHLTPCPTHGGTHTGWSPGRDRTAQHRFRTAVLTRDHNTCVDCGHHDPTGATLRACHTVPIAQGGGYDPAEGVTRCAACDRKTDPYAR